MDVWPTLDDSVAMDTSFETNNTPNNPFHVNNTAPQPQTNGCTEPSYQKANLLLDLAGGDNFNKLNASSPSETDLYFLNRPANGKGETNYEDDDFGPETDVDAIDDVLLSPAIAAAAKAAAAATLTTLGDDVRQELDAFVPGREETPTPPADEVTGRPALLPESENVAESGEESEDEWNYYRVEPTEKSVEQHPTEKTAEDTQEEDEASMESRLNPNAAEFVPSPTTTKPSMEELLSESPRKGGVIMDDVHMPSPIEFQDEVSLRPSELDVNPFAQSEASTNLLPDLLNGKTELDSNEKNPYQMLENESDFGEVTEPINPFKSSEHLFDKSEVSSTKAEFGDETATSFLANMSDGDYMLKAGNVDHIDLDASMTESDFVAANLSQEVTSEEPNKFQNDFAATILSDEQNLSFELQKDLMASVDSEVFQIHTGSENTCLDVNSTPLDQELGLADSILPALASVDHQLDVANPPEKSSPVLPDSVDFQHDFADPPQENFQVLNSPTLHNASLSKCALSPNKEAFDLVMDFTDNLVAPTLSSITPFSDVQFLSPVCSEIENMDLEPNITNLAHLETELVSHANAEPVISGASNFVEYDPQMLLPTQATEPLISEEHNLHSLLLNQGNALPAECRTELIDEPEADMPALITDIDSKHDQEIASAVDTGNSIVSDITSQSEAVIAAASVAAVAMSAIAVETALSGNENAETKGVAKKLVAVEKAKPSSAKTTSGNKSAALTQKTQSKITPTSPTKPLMPTTRSTPTAKKPLTPVATKVTSKATTASKVTTTSKTAPSSSITSKVTASSTSQVRVKVASSPTKPTPPAKVAPTKTVAPSKPRPATATTTKAPLPEKKSTLTNGDAKPLTKRADPLAAKRLVPSTTTKPLSRPASAPVAAKTLSKTSTISRTTTASTAASKPITKPAVNGITKPKTSTTTTTVKAKPVLAASKTGTVDKQVKDTANKQISSVSAKSSTLSRTCTSTTSRKASGGVTKTTTTTTVTKSSSGPIRRPPGTTVTKTSEIITVAPMVVGEVFTTTVTKDDSPIIDNAQIEVTSTAD